jgi:anti-sigma factor RsiW
VCLHPVDPNQSCNPVKNGVMSDSQNIDDELLSAYLDNELAPEERARVEVRLADDPAARQLLDELRSVSHAVKGLPARPLGADIRDTVLRRAERAMLASKPGERASARGDVASQNPRDDLSPRFTIGRSLRGWVWAGLATAAALGIMAFESSSNRDAQLPETVAQRNAEPAGDAKPAPELRAVVKSEQLDAPSAPVASPPPGMPATPQLNTGLSVQAKDKNKSTLNDEQGSAAEDSHIAAMARKPDVGESQVANGKQTAGSAAVGGAIVSGIQPAFDADATTSGNVDNDLLVIRVQVQSEAFKGRAFDRMLDRNGIVVEESPDQSAASPLAANENERDAALKSTPESSAPSNAPAPQAGNLAFDGRPRQLDEALSNNAAAADTDLVLVEAPKEKIESCLREIQKDDHTYLGVAVDEEEILRKKADVADASKANWQQYSRGVVPQQQTLGRSAHNDYAFQTEQGPIAINRGLNDGSGAQQATEQLERKTDNTNFAQHGGRAVRMRTQSQSEDNVADRLGGNARALRLDARNAPQSNAGATRRDFGGADNKESPQQKPGQQADDTLQVLFILNSGKEPADTPAPAETKAAK